MRPAGGGSLLIACINAVNTNLRLMREKPGDQAFSPLFIGVVGEADLGTPTELSINIRFVYGIYFAKQE